MDFKTKHNIARLISTFVPEKRVGSACLMYHSVPDQKIIEARDIHSVCFEDFKRHVDIISNYKTIAFDQILEGNSSEVAITFDDGYLDNYELALPYLVGKGIPATLFMISDNLDENNKDFINASQLHELSCLKGITIGLHGKSHRPLAKLSRSEIYEEIRQSKSRIEDIIGKEVLTMSYPHGQYNREVIEVARELGLQFCGRSFSQKISAQNDRFEINRISVFYCDTPKDVDYKIRGKCDWTTRFMKSGNR